MTILEKRKRIQKLRREGVIPTNEISGADIVRMTVVQADEVLSRFEGSAVEESLAPDTPTPAEPSRNGAPRPGPSLDGGLGAMLAAAIQPHLDLQSSQVAELAKRVETIDPEQIESVISSAIAKAVAGISSPVRVVVARPELPEIEMGIQHRQFPALLKILSARCHAYLPGPAGSGKTTAASEAARALELECSSISFCAQSSKVDLLGYMDAKGEYVATEFRKRYGLGGVFVADEIDAGNPNIVSVLNSALANGHCAFPDGMIPRHEDFLFVATANTVGQGGSRVYVGRNALDGATLDRFAFLDWQYDEDLERSLSGNQEWTKRVQAWRAAAGRLNSRHIISPRASIEGAKLLAAGFDESTVAEMIVWKGIDSAERTKIEEGAR